MSEKEKSFKSWFSRKENKKYSIASYNVEKDANHLKIYHVFIWRSPFGFFLQFPGATY